MIHLQFIVLGLAAGALYVSMASGVLAGFKATGIVNFAIGAVAMWGAYTYYALRTSGSFVFIVGTVHFGAPVAVAPAMAIGVGSAVVIAVASHYLVFRPLRSAPVLAQVIASVGLLLTLQALVTVRFGSSAVDVPGAIASLPINVGGATLAGANLIYAGLAVALMCGLWCYFKFTKIGVATRASAENEEAALLMGFSASQLAVVAWCLAAATGALVAIGVTPAVGLNPVNVAFDIVPALAVALIARMRSFGVVAIAGLVLGALGGELTYLSSLTWWPSWASIGLTDALPFLVIIVVLFVGGGRLPSRGGLGTVRLPEVRVPRFRWPVVGAAVVVAVVAILLTHGSYRFGVVTSLMLVPAGLSFVIVTGYLGQISLVQAGVAGVGGLVLSKITVHAGIPFPLNFLVASVAAAALGVVVAVPALRIRGVQLAIVTMALGVAIDQFAFGNPSIVAVAGDYVPGASVFGLDVAPDQGDNVAPVAFGIMALVIVALCVLLFYRVASRSLGSAFLAVRSNERAAASIGINVHAVKIVGFALSSFLVAVTGCLLSYGQGQVSTSQFETSASLAWLALIYLGGITSLGGAVIAGLLGPLGIIYVVASQALDLGTYYDLISGLGVLLTVVLNPVGIAGGFQEAATTLRQRGAGGRAAATVTASAPQEVESHVS